uniref:Uncharacterized protein n=1 Tax=Megaviridae environmental sample TaxID=1737588 RepID=A0A5J6VLZ6_9VIRU|nr:MAG: hypothetical protein [Megaviridae environmental sample]
MVVYLLKFSVISLILIILVHYLYIYFTSLLTTPKVKDLVLVPTKKYDELYELIKKEDITKLPSTPELSSTSSKSMPVSAPLDMKAELKNYLNNQIPTLENNSHTNLLYTNIKDT